MYRSLTVLGAFRRSPLTTLSAEHIVVIQDTTHCEGLHYYAPSASLFAACEDNASTRFGWFPPLGIFDSPELGRRGKGSIHVIDPKASHLATLYHHLDADLQYIDDEIAAPRL